MAFRIHRRGAAYAAAIFLVLGWYAFVNVGANPSWVKPRAEASYELLTEGFVAGQTYLKLVPDPRLKTLVNPWAGAQGIPRAHDATYFHDRYYLYFGAAPVVLLLVPWKLLTGGYLADGAGTGLFCAAGFLLAVAFYRQCQRRFFPGLGAGWTFVFVLMLGLGSFVQFELRSADFYQVPIACAFACSMAMANALLAAAVSRSWKVQAVALAIASLCGGLAVGARPNHVFALGSVALVAGVLGWRNRRARGTLWLAGVLPAAGVGAVMATYNFVRFGSPLEFGLNYQFAAVDMRGVQLFGWSRIGLAFDGYVLAGGEYSRYFPFIRQTTENIGLLTWAPFALIAFAWPLMACSARYRERDWVLGVGAPLLGAMVNFGSLMVYYYVFDRYVLDFLPAFMLVACVMVSVGLAMLKVGRRWWVTAVILLVAYTGAHSFVHGLPSPAASPTMERWAQLLNRLPAWYEQVAGVKFGAVDAEVEFLEGTPGVTEVLLATARGRDQLTVRYLGARRAQIQFSPVESAGPASEPFDFEPGRRYRLHADLGSLYPPAEHAAYRGWEGTEITRLQRRVAVSLDGRELLDFSSSFHEAAPDRFELGGNSASRLVPPFRGRVTLVSRGGLPARSALVAPNDVAGPVQLRLRFPPFTAQVGQPLIATGRSGAGDLFYVFYAGPNRLRFGHDSWNSQGAETETVFYDPEVAHTVEVDMGSLHPGAVPADLAAGREHLRVRFDGRSIYDAPRPFNPARASEIFYGHNGIGASTSEPNFAGPRLEHRRLAGWPAAPAGGGRLLTVRLPAARVGRSEPLLVTGKQGAADVIFIRYSDAGHFQIGFDKWGYGGPISPPIAFSPAQPVEIEISLGALYGATVFDATSVDAETLRRLKRTVQVRVDGSVVLQTAAEGYPAGAGEIYVGRNPVGASSCSETFTGEMLRTEFLGAVELK